MTSNQKFWLDDPMILIKDFSLTINNEDCNNINLKLNILTRIIFIITIIMYAVEFEYWYFFLGISLLIIFALKIISGENKQEKFTIPPTYIQGSEPMSTISPLFSEEIQIPPPIFDEYTNSPINKCNGDFEYIEDTPVFGQYISNNNLFPYQRSDVASLSLNDAQLFMNNAFDEDALAFRNDMSRSYINKTARLFRNGCYDQISSYNSF
jgi:hypothetical protein